MVAESSHLILKQYRESVRLGLEWVLKPQSPTPSDTPSLTRAHLLILPKQSANFQITTDDDVPQSTGVVRVRSWRESNMQGPRVLQGRRGGALSRPLVKSLILTLSLIHTAHPLYCFQNRFHTLLKAVGILSLKVPLPDRRGPGPWYLPSAHWPPSP